MITRRTLVQSLPVAVAGMPALCAAIRVPDIEPEVSSAM